MSVPENPVIDITGDELFTCDQCSNKSTIKDRLAQHIKAKHAKIVIQFKEKATFQESTSSW